MATPHLAASLRHVVQAATLAPSVHNTQPWRFVLLEDGFELHADPSRRLDVLDPTGRQLHLSCGAALFTARAAARALGLDAQVQLLPEPTRPELLGRLALAPGAPASDADLALALAVLKRHPVRDPFEPRPVPEELLRALSVVAEQEGAALRPVCREDELVALAVLLSAADAAEERDPAYRRELAGWLRDGSSDGIPTEALARIAERGSTLRLRDFSLSRPERSSGTAPEAEHPAVVVLTTQQDDPAAWLRAGQALGAVLLHAAAQGVQAQPLGQVVDLPGPRRRLAAELGLVGTPQMVLRLGYATSPVVTARRAVDDVLV
jgi:hypothetical protein